jgi:hypothetical protein
MEEAGTNSEDAAQAIGAWRAASDASIRSTQALNDAWRLHFEGNAEAPSREQMAEVAAQRLACDLALELAQAAVRDSESSPLPETELKPELTESPAIKTRHRRRRENKFLARLGRPGTRLLRAALLLLLALALLAATGAGISLALEVAGFLHMIDDPVQLPVGIQLLIFGLAIVAVFGLKRALKPVERALYGSKGVRPKPFQL